MATGSRTAWRKQRPRRHPGPPPDDSSHSSGGIRWPSQRSTKAAGLSGGAQGLRVSRAAWRRRGRPCNAPGKEDYRNSVFLVGRIGHDPEVKRTSTGKVVCTLSVATDEAFTDAQGVKQRRTECHSVEVWGKQVLVEGALRTRKYEHVWCVQ